MSSNREIRGGSYQLRGATPQLTVTVGGYFMRETYAEGPTTMGFRVFRPFALHLRQETSPTAHRFVRGGDRRTKYAMEHLSATLADGYLEETYTNGPTTMGFRVFRPHFTPCGAHRALP